MTVVRLEPKDLWREDGHLSDLVLTALADGEDSLVPSEVHSHVATCEACSQRLGAFALQSLKASELLQEQAAVAPSTSRARAYRLPVFALVAAFVLALLGSIPRLIELRSALSEAPGSSVETGLVLLKGATLLFRSANQQDTLAVTLAWCASALAIVALGVMVARLAPLGILQRNDHASHD